MKNTRVTICTGHEPEGGRFKTTRWIQKCTRTVSNSSTAFPTLTKKLIRTNLLTPDFGVSPHRGVSSLFLPLHATVKAASVSQINWPARFDGATIFFFFVFMLRARVSSREHTTEVHAATVASHDP